MKENVKKALIMWLVLVAVLGGGLYVSKWFLGEVASFVSEVESEESVEVDKVEHKGNKGFWTDNRKVVVYTEEGRFSYPVKEVKYKESSKGNTELLKVKNKGGKEHIILEVGADNLTDIQTDYSTVYEDNISFE